jgi:hypothetical protein
LVVGIEETEGMGTNIVGVDIDADAEILGMEQILRNAMEPPISGTRMRYKGRFKNGYVVGAVEERDTLGLPSY